MKKKNLFAFLYFIIILFVSCNATPDDSNADENPYYITFLNSSVELYGIGTE